MENDGFPWEALYVYRSHLQVMMACIYTIVDYVLGNKLFGWGRNYMDGE